MQSLRSGPLGGDVENDGGSASQFPLDGMVKVAVGSLKRANDAPAWRPVSKSIRRASSGTEMELLKTSMFRSK